MFLKYHFCRGFYFSLRHYFSEHNVEPTTMVRVKRYKLFQILYIEFYPLLFLILLAQRTHALMDV